MYGEECETSGSSGLGDVDICRCYNITITGF